MDCLNSGTLILTCIPLCPYSGAELNQEGENERTPLHEAAEAGHTNIVKWLIKKGADTVARDNNDLTPYDLAFQKGWKQVCNVFTCVNRIAALALVNTHPTYLLPF